MMLEFYGMRLINTATGEINRVDEKKFYSRYIDTFIKSPHNHLRITRILFFLTLVGFRKYA